MPGSPPGTGSIVTTFLRELIQESKGVGKDPGLVFQAEGKLPAGVQAGLEVSEIAEVDSTIADVELLNQRCVT